MRLQPEILEQSFAALAPQGERLVHRFYDRLFRDYPQVRPLFAQTDMPEQERKLLASLQLVIANVRKPAELSDALAQLACRHLDYGAQRGHYDAVVTTLLLTLAEVAGDLWTDPVAAAWRDALNLVQQSMVEAAYPEQEAVIG